jgi:hypothetical protein
MSNSNIAVNATLGNNTTAHQQNANESQGNIPQEEIPTRTIAEIISIIMGWIEINMQLPLDYCFSEASKWDMPPSY